MATVRACGPRDREAVAALHAAVPPEEEHDFEPRTVADLDRLDGALDRARQPRLRLVAEVDGAVAGVATAFGMTWDPSPDTAWVGVRVTKAARGAGIGAALWTHLRGALAARGVRRVRGEAREDNDAVLDLLARRGAIERFRSWDLRVDLAARPLPEPRADLTLTSVTDALASSPRLLGPLRDLFANLYAEVPLPGLLDVDPDVADFEAFLRSAPTAVPQISAVALVEDTPVGLAILHRHPDVDGRLDHHFTGVAASGRGRGLARALKVHTMRAAAQAGYRVIHTAVESNNPPIVKLNRDLGFEVIGGLVVWDAPLEAMAAR